ncbi:hypothetical protein E2C01_042308 [Portunus trituberculatus]|uniref:Uncharacterized protein n=1 Tax=Portunus trituberculatus TaxID=210409 RepID=A0A5B7FW48_PORTR|nr:hypothetical protein [Portunus trituberculatus]
MIPLFLLRRLVHRLLITYRGGFYLQFSFTPLNVLPVFQEARGTATTITTTTTATAAAVTAILYTTARIFAA